MKTKIFTAMLMLVLAGFAQATFYSSTGSPSATGVLPDGSAVGLVSTLGVDTGGDNSTINGVSVTLNISGGYNGDLYGYLVNPNGNMAVLLNRVGTGSGGAIQTVFGYSDGGLNVVLSDAGMPAGSVAGSLHTYGAGDIASGTTAWSSDNGTGDFTALQNGGGNGTWTLFLADLSTGGGQSTLMSWGLEISVVPEPVTWALVGFGGVAGLVVLVRRRSDVGGVYARFAPWVNAV